METLRRWKQLLVNLETDYTKPDIQFQIDECASLERSEKSSESTH